MKEYQPIVHYHCKKCKNWRQKPVICAPNREVIECASSFCEEYDEYTFLDIASLRLHYCCKKYKEKEN